MLSIEWYINTNSPYSYRRSDPLKPGRSSGKSLGIFSFPLHFPTIFISLSIVDVALNRASLFMSGVLERIKTNSNTNGTYNCETNSSSIQIEKTVFGHIVFVCSLYSFTNLHCFPLQLNDEIYAVRPRV